MCTEYIAAVYGGSPVQLGDNMHCEVELNSAVSGMRKCLCIQYRMTSLMRQRQAAKIYRRPTRQRQKKNPTKKRYSYIF